jgi:hypothetical protein
MTDSATPHFETQSGRWPLAITPPISRRIRDKFGVDLFAVTAPAASNPFVRLSEEPLLLADVLWDICQPLAAERGLDRDAFETEVWTAIDAVVSALLAGVVASFPEKKRAGLTKMIAAQDAALDRILAALTPKLDALIDAAVEDAVANAMPNPSTRTNSPPN